MAGIKQTVPNYIFGASNQPDQLKIPGFVNEAVNIYPDVTEGCEKRPGTRHINKLETVRAPFAPKWFAIDYGVDNSFIGHVDHTGHVKVFECATGVEWPVYMNDITYLAGDPANIQVASINDSTIMLNRSVNARMDTSGTYIAPAQGNKAFVDLSAIAYGKQYSLDITELYTTDLDVAKVTTRATKLSIKWDPGGNRRDDDDNDSGENVDSEESCRYNTREIRTINAVGSDKGPHKHAEFDMGDIIDLPGKNLRFEVSMIGTPFVAGYHKSRDGEPYYWALYDINIDLLHGGEGWRQGDTFKIQIGDEHADGDTQHIVTVEEIEEIQTKANWLIRPEPTTHDGSQVLTADKILDSLKKEILRHNGDFTIEKIGSGLLLENSSPFKVTTTESNLLSIIGNDTSSVANLPSECQVGYVVKVSNSSLDEDDYYLKFTGEHTWVETVKPGSFNHIDPGSMPHQLIKVVSPSVGGTSWFSLEPLQWADRLAGDDITNPRPTFLKAFGTAQGTLDFERGSKINKILFWRNRLAILSENTICLTQPLTTEIDIADIEWADTGNIMKGDYYDYAPGRVWEPAHKAYIATTTRLSKNLQSRAIFNVWGKSAIALSPGDAIDITATSNQVCDLRNGIEVNAGLMLFSEFEQFLLTTDSDVVTPETVKLKPISSWSYNDKLSPISLGNSIAFCDNAGRHSRLFEMSNITRETEPLVTELSKPITEDIPHSIKSIAESRENGLVLLTPGQRWDYPLTLTSPCDNPYDYVYGYKYFTSGSKRIQSAWFKWKFPGQVIWHTIIRDTYYLIVDNNNFSDVRLLAMDLVRKEDSILFDKQHPETCAFNGIHLDEMVETATTPFYDGTSTRFSIPNSFYTGTSSENDISVVPGQLWVYSDYGSWQERNKATVSGGEAVVAGDVTAGNIIMGIEYDMKLKLPQIYPTKKAGDVYIADTTSTLTVHRCKFSVGMSGPFSVTINSKNRDSYSMDFESDTNHTFYTNFDNILTSQTVDVPIYQPNTDFKLEFRSNNPAPCTLNSMTWEGDYNTLYKSV